MLFVHTTQGIINSYVLPYKSARSRSLCPRRGQARWISPWISASRTGPPQCAPLPGRKWKVRPDGWIYICHLIGARKIPVIVFSVLWNGSRHTRELSSKQTKRRMAEKTKQVTNTSDAQNESAKSNQHTRGEQSGKCTPAKKRQMHCLV